MTHSILFLLATLYIDLSGEWRQRTEDRPEFARADFDDRAWAPIAVPLLTRLPDDVTWLRRGVNVPEWADRGQLALTLGELNDVYEVYVNGMRIGGTGALTARDARIPRPLTFAIPAETMRGARMQIAVRTKRFTFRRPSPWGLRFGGPFLLTYHANAPKSAEAHSIAERRLRHAPNFLLAVLEAGLALVIFLVWAGEREHAELQWMIWFLAMDAADLALIYYTVSADSFPFRWPVYLEHLIKSLAAVALAEFAMRAMRMSLRFVRIAVWSIFAILPLSLLAGDDGSGWFFPTVRAIHAATLGIVVAGWWRMGGRRQELSRHIFAGTLALLGLVSINTMGAAFGLPRWMDIGPFEVQYGGTLGCVLAAMVTIQLLRWLAADRQEKHRLAGEMESARTLQQTLLARSSLRNESYEVEAVYRPALEVGGDFFELMNARDGTLLIAVGDVSGKGLKAAMVVALLTGALRNRQSDEPGAVLGELNRTLAAGLDGGFVTCCIARLRASGDVRMASAGHPAPFSAGREIGLEPGLPLGVMADAEYTSSPFDLLAGQALTFVSDGVVEAANMHGDLLGFDRTRELSGKCAADIANAAQAFGQNDDITVVTVRRIA